MPPGFAPNIPMPIRDTDDIVDFHADGHGIPGAHGGARPPPPNRDPADWECPNTSCRNINFKKRTKCNLCGSMRADQKPGEAPTTIPLTIQGPPGLFKAGDWACPSCGNVNWDWRDRCNICNNLKPELQDKREGGRGGGYFDRQDPQDKKAWDSDEEIFDEFGRKKKKGKGVKASTQGPADPTEKEKLAKAASDEKKRRQQEALDRLLNRGKEPVKTSPERNARDRDAAEERGRRMRDGGNDRCCGGDNRGDRSDRGDRQDRDRGSDRGGDRGSSRRFDDRDRDRDRGDRDRYDRGTDRGDGYKRRRIEGDRDRDRDR